MYEFGICALCFNVEGSLLCVVGMDRNHRLGIWDWKNELLLAQTAARTGNPPQLCVLFLFSLLFRVLFLFLGFG